MHYLKSLLAVSTVLVGVALAQSNLKFTFNPSLVVAGTPTTLAWDGGDLSQPVTIILRKGDPSNLDTVETITDGASGGVFVWTPSTTLINGDDYALEIKQGSEDNYSGEFSLAGGAPKAAAASTTTTASSDPTTAKPGSTSAGLSSVAASLSSEVESATSLVASVTSAASLSTTAPAASTSSVYSIVHSILASYGSAVQNATSGIANPSGTGVSSIPRNTTLSSATLTTSKTSTASTTTTETSSSSGAASSGTGSSGTQTSSSSKPNQTNGATVVGYASPLALVACAVAALTYLN
ncbi:hypothetical protein L228DRAFT_246639 [Xylona heveae TC161]|uniref:Yeast cell wall synthesis Kre9/Knh1-like N-terminal domain-containing protein n=1 Tax=Xylona heveae (strain CBS 132557 / TC161) TaxID=1328760 RepID=A0A165HP65_XYLHT|nr:hypothetical protein L228DRAFT_246639 [Xylona heveae TC161]KZF23794.1 hypothetical protein L228DRAFT_246639 [Xylona heveae TC161]